MQEKASSIQVGGNHYRKFAIQPSEFCQRNGLGWCESNVVKYVSRHGNKNGAEDIKKAIHYLNLLLEWQYPQPAKLSPFDLVAKGELPAGFGPFVAHTDGPVLNLAAPKGADNCANHSSDCLDCHHCQQYLRLTAHAPLDFRLPTIALRASGCEAYKKYREEFGEFVDAENGSMDELIEAWDVVQARQTFIEHNGNAEDVDEDVNVWLQLWHDEGRPVIEAKNAMLRKNALRNYYAPLVNLAIAAGTWHP